VSENITPIEDTKKPAEVLPEKMSEKDIMRMQLANEKLRRAQAEFALSQNTLRGAQGALQMLNSEMESRYKLGKEDAVEIETGKIVRKTSPQAEPAKA
jgi:hypothetical protein